jgi:hypothetical protein
MAKDLYHNVVKQALINDGWTITDDPFYFSVGTVSMQIDIGAERIIAAEKGMTKIAVEIKSFVSQSPVNDFHAALGQYELYEIAMSDYEPERVLYLAVPQEAYNEFFQRPLIQKVIRLRSLKLLVYQPENENYIEWIK